jgi:hypothetical protein
MTKKGDEMPGLFSSKENTKLCPFKFGDDDMKCIRDRCMMWRTRSYSREEWVNPIGDQGTGYGFAQKGYACGIESYCGLAGGDPKND